MSSAAARRLTKLSQHIKMVNANESSKGMSQSVFTMSQSQNRRKITILGAAGGIGQPLSLLLKAFSERPSSAGHVHPHLHLALYDIVNMGMYADLAHISTPVKVTGHSGKEELGEALDGAHVVLIPAGVPRKPGMTRDDLFSINAGIVRDLTTACARHCPNAHLLVISNPVNATVPIAYETLKAMGIKRPSVFGITTLDIVRSQTFVAEELGEGIDPETLEIKVIGGHSGQTIIPLIGSLIKNKTNIPNLIQRIQYGGDEVVKAKAGGGSATLSMAYAALRFYTQFMRALDGANKERMIAYVNVKEYGASEAGLSSSNAYPTEYFATEVEVGYGGLECVLPMPKLDTQEQEMLKVCVAELERDIAKGKSFVTQGSSKQKEAN